MVEDDSVTQLTRSQQPAAQSIDDPIKVLKLRFAKGEITKEEYDEMKRTLES